MAEVNLMDGFHNVYPSFKDNQLKVVIKLFTLLVSVKFKGGLSM